VKYNFRINITFLLVFIACNCSHIDQPQQLSVRERARVEYRCGNGERIIATYYTLSDSSLDFVKVVMPDSVEYTLPNVVSASGARYSDDRTLVWWTKGETAFAQTRDQNGEWQVTCPDCRAVKSGE
jgi:membrane-bound inhibitor of C-type lysozyme